MHRRAFEHPLDIGCGCLGHGGVRGVDDDLRIHFRAVLTQEYGCVYLAAPQHRLDLCGRRHAHEGEIAVGAEPLYDVARGVGMPVGHGHDADVVDLGRDCESEKQKQYQRHQQRDDHGARVADDVQRLLVYE